MEDKLKNSLFVISIFFCRFAFSQQSCVDQKIVSLLKAHQLPEVKISEEYFRDIHTNSTKSCFDLKIGSVYQRYNITRKNNGTEETKIREMYSDLYRWVPTKYVKSSSGNEVTISTEYFKKIKTNRTLSCFTLKEGISNYQIIDAHEAQGLFMVEIRNTKSDVSLWINSERIELLDKSLTKNCATTTTNMPRIAN